MKKQGMVSVFKKLYILFVIIIVIIYVSTIIIFLKYAKQQRNVEIGGMQSAVVHNVSALEQQLEIIYNLERNLVSDGRISSLVYDTSLNGYERSQLMLALLVNMQGFQSLNNIIEDITIIFPKQEMELSAVEGHGSKEYVPIPRNGDNTARSLVYCDGKAQMELLYPLTYSIEEDYVPDFGVSITLSEDYLQELLELFGSGEQAGAFFVLDGGEVLGQQPVEGEAQAQLMDCWYRAWEKQGGGESFLGKGRCLGTSNLFMSESIPGYGITVVAYRSGRGIGSSAMVALLMMGVVLLVISILFFEILYQANTAVNKPLKKVVQAFGQVQEGNLEIRIFHKPQDEFQYIYSSFNRMVERIQELIENVKEQGRLLQNAELMQLQSQINPHFLYNSFYLIRIMAKNESYDQIIQFVTSLAKYYRFLNKEVEQNILLSREVEHMENYIDIQQMRFGDKITVHKGQLPESAAGFLVPKLILQPVIENAYNYGMSDILKDGRIAISYSHKEPYLCIVIEDNGNGGSSENIERMREYIQDYQGRAAGHALSNIERRLKLAYGETSGILLEQSELGGLKVILRIDMRVTL